MGRNPPKSTSLLISIGIGSLWMWVFCLFPSIGANSLLGAHTEEAVSAWTISLLSGLASNVVLLVVSRRILTERHLLACLVGGCGLQILAVAALSLGGTAALADWVGGASAGAAIVLLWLPWGVRLVSVDVAKTERVIAGALICVAGGYAFVVTMPSSVSSVLLCVLPFVHLGMYAVVSRGMPALPRFARTSTFRALIREKSPLRTVLMQCLIAYGLVSFTWECLRSQTSLLSDWTAFLFAGGFLLASFALRLFARYASRVDASSSIRWVLPIAAFGVAMGMDSRVGLVACGLVLVATAHASFEGVLRMQVISLARRNEKNVVALVIVGFATITIGAFLGVIAFYLFSLFSISKANMALYVLAVVTCLALVCFKEPRGRDARGRGQGLSGSKQDVCLIMAERFGFTPRETEILGYLLEGRSHPYIRDELVISKSTVDTHVRHIYAKMGISSKQDLISVAQSIERE